MRVEEKNEFLKEGIHSSRGEMLTPCKHMVNVNNSNNAANIKINITNNN